MRLIPVLDILNGIAVHAVAGRRDEYRPLSSLMCASCDPLDVARAVREWFGLTEFYVADLDAILHARPNVDLWRRMACEGFNLLLDAGVCDAASAERVLCEHIAAAVLGLETLPGPELLGMLVGEFGAERLIFSLDMKHGALLGDVSGWASSDPPAIAAEAAARGIDQFLVLDLAAVGTDAGTPTLPLCVQIAAQLQPKRLFTGGGVRDLGDLEAVANTGVTDALVATALYGGRLCK